MKLPIERIGNKIRTLRKQQSQTLEDLSQKTGLSKGLLSQVERGISQPSLETLWKITKALDASIVHFFEDVAGTGVQVLRKQDRNQFVFPDSQGTFYNLYQGSQAKLCIMEAILEPGEMAKEQLAANAGEHFIVVIQGSLHVRVGDQEFSLNEGDSICFESSHIHTVRNDGNEAAKCIWMITPHK